MYKPNCVLYRELISNAIKHQDDCEFFASILGIIAIALSYLSPGVNLCCLPEFEKAAVSVMKNPAIKKSVAIDILNSLSFMSCTKCAIFNRGIKSDIFSNEFITYIVSIKGMGPEFERARLPCVANFMDARNTFNSSYSLAALSALSEYILSVTAYVPDRIEDALCVVRMLSNGLYAFVNREDGLSTLLGILQTYPGDTRILLGVAMTTCKMVMASLIPEGSYLGKMLILKIREIAEGEGCKDKLFMKIAWTLLAGVYNVKHDVDDDDDKEVDEYKRLIKKCLPSN